MSDATAVSRDHPAWVAFAASTAELDPISLAVLNERASLQQRVDRKYVVTAEQLDQLRCDLLPRLAILEIEGRRSFRYESNYFDTPDLCSYHLAARRRRRRFKVRTRTYLDSDTTMLEVKLRVARGVTIKHRRAHPFALRSSLDGDALAFVEETIESGGVASSLLPTLTTTYRRMTLLDREDIVRITIDSDVGCADTAGRAAALVGRFIVETKSASATSTVDRRLWEAGIRPVSISKFATGLAALRPDLPANRWHRTLRRHSFQPTTDPLLRSNQ